MKRSGRILLALFFFLLLPSRLTASALESLPTWHWAYRTIDDLRNCGMLLSLSPLKRPFARGDVARALNHLQEDIESGRVTPDSAARNVFDILCREFASEMDDLKRPGKVGPSFSAGGRIHADLDRPFERGLRYRGVYRSRISVVPDSHFLLFNGICLDAYRADDSLYVGNKWRGIAGYTEQAYAAFSEGRFRLLFGRDFLGWGAGLAGNLVFSDHARPLDLFSVDMDLGIFEYTFLVSRLEDWTLSADWADSLGAPSARRFLCAHRVDASFWNGRLRIGVVEAVLAGGKDRSLEWAYANPFLSFHGENMNGAGPANSLGGVDFWALPLAQWALWGSVLVDDIQIEKTGPGDLEPNEIGGLIGTRITGPFGFHGFSMAGEYVRVANRTYKTAYPWETWIRLNEPLGHPFGNDFDAWTIQGSFWAAKGLRIDANFSSVRHGEGALLAVWDTPWLDHSLEDGYSEPFPSGVVQRTKTAGVGIQFFPSVHWGLESSVDLFSHRNLDNTAGKEQNALVWRIRMWFDGDVRLNL